MLTNAVARFTGSHVFFAFDPGACAPGFMLSLASRALCSSAPRALWSSASRALWSLPPRASLSPSRRVKTVTSGCSSTQKRDNTRVTAAYPARRCAVFEELRRRLFGIAYRMIGTTADAEDIASRKLTYTSQPSRLRQTANRSQLCTHYSIPKTARTFRCQIAVTNARQLRLSYWSMIY